MPTILFTGQGTYLQAKNLFDPAEAIRYAGETQAKLMEYAYNIRQQRQKQLMDMMDIKTDNFMFDQLQQKAAKNIEDFTNQAIDIWNKSGNNPTTEDWINIGKARRDVEQSNQMMLNKSNQYKQSYELLMKDGGKTFDWDNNINMLSNFSQHPLTAEITPLELKYKEIDEIFNEDYKLHPWYKDGEMVNGTKDGQSGAFITRKRTGLEDDTKREQAFNNLWNNNVDFKRSIINERAKLKKADQYTWSQYKNDFDYAKQTYFPLYGQPERVFHAYKPTQSKGGFSISMGGTGQWVFAPQEDVVNPVTNTKEKGFVVKKKSGTGGMPIGLVGEVMDMTGKPIKTTGKETIEVTDVFKDYAVGNILKGSKEVDEYATSQISSDAEKSKQYLNASMVGQVFESIDGSKRTVIYQNGQYKISKPITEQQSYIDLRKGKNRKNVYSILGGTLNAPDLEKQLNDYFGGSVTTTTEEQTTEEETDVLP